MHEARPPSERPQDIDALQSRFLALLPQIETIAWFRLRYVPCPDHRQDLQREVVAVCWLWFVRLTRTGRTPADFLGSFVGLAVRAVRSGRRLCGSERARDALSPVCQRRRNFAVATLPDGSGMIGNLFDQALIDNTQTPILDQVQFRIDFPRWRAALETRRQALVDAMAVGHRTMDLAAKFGVSPARVSQMRGELHDGWRTFCGDDLF